MTAKIVKQQVTATPGSPINDVKMEHPAQGCVTVTKRSYGGGPNSGITLFGSDIKHHSVVHLSVKSATGYRGLHSDRHYGDEIICELEFSEAQWASFVSSIGMGAGVPCTFTHKPAAGYKLEQMPRLEVQPLVEKFAEEIKEAPEDRVKDLYVLVQRIETTMNGPSRAGLKDMVRDLKIKLENLPSNMGFIQKQFGEALENAIEAGKSDIEAFTRNTLVRAGMAHLADQARVELIEAPAKALPNVSIKKSVKYDVDNQEG